MPLDVLGIFEAAESHAAASGYFDRVNFHEPKNAPGHGLTCALWVQDIGPDPAATGLVSTSARLVLNVRVYAGMLQEPQDAIDPAVLIAVIGLIAAYSGDFELGGLIRNVDLLGQSGVPLSAAAGYLNQSGHLYRVMTITLPLIVSDVWVQAP